MAARVSGLEPVVLVSGWGNLLSDSAVRTGLAGSDVLVSPWPPPWAVRSRAGYSSESFWVQIRNKKMSFFYSLNPFILHIELLFFAMFMRFWYDSYFLPFLYIVFQIHGTNVRWLSSFVAHK